MAVLWMIETHVFNTFLDNSLTRAEIWNWLNFLNGLVAPGFLLIAGYLHGFSTGIRGDRPSRNKRSWTRLLGIMGFGYLLHFPLHSLLAGQWSDAARTGLQVDILQCLAASLLIVRGVERIARGAWPMLAGAAVFVGSAAWMHGWDGFAHPLWVPLAGYFNNSLGSLFPLFPWAGFVFFGALIGRCEAQLAWVPQSLKWLALGAVVFLGLAKALTCPPFDAYGTAFFLQRLGWLVLAGTLVRMLPAAWLWQPVQIVGRKSLAFYAIHLLIISQLQLSGVPTGGWLRAAVLLLIVTAATASAIWLIAVLSSYARKLKSRSAPAEHTSTTEPPAADTPPEAASSHSSRPHH